MSSKSELESDLELESGKEPCEAKAVQKTLVFCTIPIVVRHSGCGMM